MFSDPAAAPRSITCPPRARTSTAVVGLRSPSASSRVPEAAWPRAMVRIRVDFPRAVQAEDGHAGVVGQPGAERGQRIRSHGGPGPQVVPIGTPTIGVPSATLRPQPTRLHGGRVPGERGLDVGGVTATGAGNPRAPGGLSPAALESCRSRRARVAVGAFAGGVRGCGGPRRAARVMRAGYPDAEGRANAAPWWPYARRSPQPQARRSGGLG